MLPNRKEVHIGGNVYQPRGAHSMAGRYGENSKSEALLRPVQDQKLFETSSLDNIDKTIFKGKAATTYRFTGPSFIAMVDFIKQLVAQAQKWDMYNYNCAQAVADCLSAGGAPHRPNHAHFTPNRVAEWCEVLCKTYDGSQKKNNL
jgi:hypothetical protein